VCAWFANRSDVRLRLEPRPPPAAPHGRGGAQVILLLFDAHKLDISDEFKEAIDSLKGHDDKIRVVLNKADMVSASAASLSASAAARTKSARRSAL